MSIMTIAEIQELGSSASGKKVHQSSLRAYRILEKVKDYLARGVPVDVMLELVEEMEAYDVEIKTHRGRMIVKIETEMVKK